jgi:ubiquinone/menaquinone biosynthesis C-methylase UbiE
VLDVAAGTGNAAIPAAQAGAEAVASDLTPSLLATGRALAAARGAVEDWREGDAEALPFADGSFEVVLSCVGVMFAPHTTGPPRTSWCGCAGRAARSA